MTAHGAAPSPRQDRLRTPSAASEKRPSDPEPGGHQAPPKVLVVAYYFPPIGGGGVQRNAKFVRYLPEHGFTPIVITGPGRTSDRWSPEDKTLEADIPPEVVVHRLRGPEPDDNYGLRCTIEHTLMVKPPSIRWWIEGAVQIARGVGPVDVIYGSLAPYDTAEAAVRIAKELGRPWVADLQDPWALDEMWLYPSGLHRARDARRMRSLLGTAAAIVMNTPEAAKRLTTSFPELGSKIVVSITNGFDRDDFEGPEPPHTTGRFRIVHTGYLHTDQGLRLRGRSGRVRRLLGGLSAPIDILPRSHFYLLQALDLVVAEDPAAAAELELVLAGVTNDLDREVVGGRPFVRMPGYVSHRESIDLVRSADLLFLPMHDLPAGTRAGIIPGKTFEYLAAGAPILAAVPDGDARDLLVEGGNGYVCTPKDVRRMADTIARLLTAWRLGDISPQTTRAEVLARYERRYLTSELAQLFRTVVEARRTTSQNGGGSP